MVGYGYFLELPNSAELALVKVKGSRLPAAHPHQDIPKVPPPPGLLVGKLSRGLIIATVSKAKSCFIESLNKVQVRDGQMGRKDQKAGNLLVK